MKRVYVFFLLIMSVCFVQGKEDFNLSDIFGNDSCFSCKAELLINMLNQEQSWDAQVFSTLVERDSLCKVNYWVEMIDNSDVINRYVYYDGNFILQLGDRMRKLNSKKDSVMFKDRVIRGRKIKGIHKTGIHSFLIPQITQELIQDLVRCGDSKFEYVTDSVYNGKPVEILYIDEIVGDVVVRKMQFIVGKQKRFPIEYNIITSPGAMGQMIMEIKFTAVSQKNDESKMKSAIKSLLNE